MDRLRLAWSEVAPWIAAALVALTVSWAADGVKDSVEAWIKGETVKVWIYVVRVISVILFVATAMWLYRVRQRLFQPRTRFVRNEIPEKREHLILFLSHLDISRGKLRDGVPEGITLTGELEKDLDTLVAWKQQGKPYWPWEMPLRGIRHHLGRLRTVTVICSPQSILQVHWFGQILACYEVLRDVSVRIFVQEENRSVLAVCPETPLARGGWEFEQFDDLSRAVLHLLRDLKNQRVIDNQIMIDFTGGQKVTSVVAASVTFNRTVKAQYVQTNHPHNVISYDIVLGSADTGELGL